MADADQNLVNRSALGALIRIRRGHEGISVEALAERARLGHMTLRRIEEGHPVRQASYAALESALGLPVGIVSRALTDEAAMVELAGHLGVAGPDENQSPRAWLASFALPTVWTQQLTQSKSDDLEIASELLKRLSARRKPTELEKRALSAVYALVGEWAGLLSN